MTTGLIRFANDPDCRDLVHEAGWTGPWPPPEQMFLAVGITTGRTAVAEQDGIMKLKENPDWQDYVVIQEFRRVRASSLSDDDVDSGEGFVMRGAVYVPVFSGVDDA